VKAKARECVVAVLASLRAQPSILRQWTARHVSDAVPFGFCSVFPHGELPAVRPADLFEWQTADPPEPAAGFGLRGTRMIDADIPPQPGCPDPRGDSRGTRMRGSESVVDFNPMDLEFTESFEALFGKPTMKKSGSVQVQSFGRTWNLFDDDDTLF
jgi:hypothetical protein